MTRRDRRHETENEELIWIRFRTAEVLQKVIVIGDPERVRRPAAHVGAECESLQLGWDHVRSDAIRGQHGDDIQEQRLAHGTCRRLRAIHVADVNRVSQINLENLFDLGIVAGASALAVALVNQELVLIQCHNLAHATSSRQQLAILMSRPAGRDVDGDYAQQVRRRATLRRILGQRILKDADQRLWVGSKLSERREK